MTKIFTSIIFSAIAIIPVYAQEQADTLKTQELNEVVVEATMQRTDAKKSTYIPTVRQKNASQSGADLLDQMSIPQLNVTLNGDIKTNSGKEVAVFIDYIPATENDLKAMRISDVKRVEYYEYPSDPRLQGHQFVVNYILTKYEYGGYVKVYDHTNLLHYSEQLLGNVRLQYKDMTYDLMGYGWGHNSSHYGSDLTETYRLPQEDGSMKVFDRYSNTTSSKENRQQYFAAFKATYNTDKIQASTLFNGSINRKPHSDRCGEVIYSPADFLARQGRAVSFGFCLIVATYSFGFYLIFIIYSFGFLQSVGYHYNLKRLIDYGKRSNICYVRLLFM